MALETQEIVGGIRVGKLGGSIMMGGLWEGALGKLGKLSGSWVGLRRNCGEGLGEAGIEAWGKLGWILEQIWSRVYSIRSISDPLKTMRLNENVDFEIEVCQHTW